MSGKIEDEKIAVIATILDKPYDKVKQVLLSEFVDPKVEGELIAICDLKEKLGWSHSTLKRRCKEFSIEFHTLPGWKTKKGLYVREFEEKTGLKIKTKKEVS